MTFLSYFCQADIVENNHEDNDSSQNSQNGKHTEFRTETERREPEIKPTASDNLVAAVLFGG